MLTLVVENQPNGTLERARGTRSLMPEAAHPNARWSLDFLSDSFGASHRFRILALIDDCYRESLCLIADTSTSGGQPGLSWDIAGRIHLTAVPQMDQQYPGKFVADLDITFTHGTTQHVFVEDPIGTAHNPIPRADQDTKFAELTHRVIGKQQAASLLQALDRLDPELAAADMAALTSAPVP